MAINSELIAELMVAVRTKTDTGKSEVTNLASSCISDLRSSGVYVYDLNDPLVKQAIRLYVKGNYGYDSDTQKFSDAYDKLKISMALSGDYDKVGADS